MPGWLHRPLAGKRPSLPTPRARATLEAAKPPAGMVARECALDYRRSVNNGIVFEAIVRVSTVARIAHERASG